jgi:hypothetical protein
MESTKQRDQVASPSIAGTSGREVRRGRSTDDLDDVDEPDGRTDNKPLLVAFPKWGPPEEDGIYADIFEPLAPPHKRIRAKDLR